MTKDEGRRTKVGQPTTDNRQPLPRSLRRELLDETVADQRELAANLADLRVVNRWLGGTASVVQAVAQAVGDERRPLSILDVATGSGDVPLALRRWAQQHCLAVQVYGSDLSPDVLAEARVYTQGRVRLLRHDALLPPFAPGTIDVVTCAQTLHHFDPPAAVALLRALAATTRRALVVSDLRRSRAAYWGARALAYTQRSSMSRHDGPLSVLRSYTLPEVRQLCCDAGLRNAAVRPAGPFRFVILWRPPFDDKAVYG